MNALQNVLFKGKSLVVELSAENAYGYKFVCKKDEDENGERFYAKKKLDGEPKPRQDGARIAAALTCLGCRSSCVL